MLNPIVSVILPTYNRRSMLLEAISSVLVQTEENLELIVVDDGSTDGTAAAVATIADGRIRYIHQPNRGSSAARNVGISAAKTRYCAFLDSDDLWYPNKLSAQLAEFKANESLVAVYCDYDIIRGQDPSRIAHGRHFRQPSERLHLDLLRYGNLISGSASAVMARKDLVVGCGGFDENLTAYEDLDLWRRLSQLGQFYRLNEILVSIRVYDYQVQKNYSLMAQNALRYVKKLKRHPANSIEERSAIRQGAARIIRDEYMPWALATGSVTEKLTAVWLGTHVAPMALSAYCGRTSARIIVRTVQLVIKSTASQLPLKLRKSTKARGLVRFFGVKIAQNRLEVRRADRARYISWLISPAGTREELYLRKVDIGISGRIGLSVRNIAQGHNPIAVVPQAVYLPSPPFVKFLALRRYSNGYGLQTFVETGTFLGDTTQRMATCVNKCYTIELSKELHKRAVERFRLLPMIECIQGDSAVALNGLVSRLKEPALFWLDAHASGGITADSGKDPILDELSIIFGSGLRGNVVLIDDARGHDLKAISKLVPASHSFSVRNDIIRIVPV